MSQQYDWAGARNAKAALIIFVLTNRDFTGYERAGRLRDALSTPHNAVAFCSV